MSGRGKIVPLLTLMAAIGLPSSQVPAGEAEPVVPKDKVLETCGTQKYESVITDINGLKVRFFCDPYMPPLLLNGKGSSADVRENKNKPGPAISETLPECPPSDKAYGLCEMTKLDRELRQKMMELEEKKSYARLKAAEERARREEEMKKLPPPPPPCTPLKDVGIFQGMNTDILSANGSLMRVIPTQGDVRLVFRITRPALYGPMSRVKENDLVAIDAVASRSQFAVPILPTVTVTKEQADNLCLDKVKTGDLTGVRPLMGVLADHAAAKPGEGKVRLTRPSQVEEDQMPDLPPSGPIKLPDLLKDQQSKEAPPIDIVPQKK